MSVSFEELDHSPRLWIKDGQVSAQRMFLIAWSDWPAFVAELYGSYTFSEDVAEFTPPASFPGWPDLIVEKIDVEPYPGQRAAVTNRTDLSHGFNHYAYAKVTAEYGFFTNPNRSGAPTFRRLPVVPNGTYLEFEAELAAEYVTSPGRYWRWQGAPDERVSDDAHVGLLRPCEQIIIRWRRVPAPPFTVIQAKRGSINAGEFLGLPGGTVLFLGARVRRDFQFIDSGLWRVEYHFKAREPGWNLQFKPGDGWQPIEDDAGTLPYDETDFASLFEFGI